MYPGVRPEAGGLSLQVLHIGIGPNVIDDGNQPGTERIRNVVDYATPPEARRCHERDPSRIDVVCNVLQHARPENYPYRIMMRPRCGIHIGIVRHSRRCDSEPNALHQGIAILDWRRLRTPKIRTCSLVDFDFDQRRSRFTA